MPSTASTIKVQKLDGPAVVDRITVRLIGIDTPETKKPGTAVECGGREATATMLVGAFTAPVDSRGLLVTSCAAAPIG